MLSTIDLHWTAGFLEGEGCFMAVKNTRKHVKISGVYWIAVVDAAQVNREPLERLQALFGGKIVKIKQTGNRQQAGAWRLTGRKAIGFMMTMWTLMSGRRRAQIEIAIERWKLNQGAGSDVYRSSRACGERNGSSKLSACDAQEIFASTDTNSCLASRYNVCSATISNIKNRKVWAHVNRAIA